MTIDKNIPIKNIYYMLTYAFKELKHNNYEHIVGENFDNSLKGCVVSFKTRAS